MEFVANTMQQPVTADQHQKPWSAKKDEILRLWQQLRPDQPVIMQPMPPSNQDTDHTSYGEDGIRITGSWQFIAGVLSKLKSVLAYENPTNKLRLVFRGVDSSRQSRPDRQSYVFYVNLQPRSKGRPGRKKNKFGTLA